MTDRKKKEYIFTFIAEFAAIMCSLAASMFFFTYVVKRIYLEYYSKMDFELLLLILLISFVFVFFNFEHVEGIHTRTVVQQLKYTSKIVFFNSATTVLLMALTKSGLFNSRYLLFGIFIFHFIFSFAFNRILKYLIRSFICNNEKLVSLVGIVTVSDRLPQLKSGVESDWSKKITGVALMDVCDSDVGKSVEGLKVRANFNNFIDWIRHDALDEVYFDIPYDTGSSITPFIAELCKMGVDVHLNIPFMDTLSKAYDIQKPNTGIENIGGKDMLTMKTVQHSTRGYIVKRLMDIVGSIVGLIISIPIIAITAIPLKLESPGPLFFKQKRVGLNGRYFYIYKLRSMYMDAEERKKELMAKNEMKGLMFKMTDDPRITKVGKFIRKTSIDELPQFFNVFKGDMSLVGTRPPTVDEYVKYESHHKHRLSMKPGITGLWQVSGRSEIEDFEDVIKLDVEYIDNWTVWLDIKILFKTVKTVLFRVGAK